MSLTAIGPNELAAVVTSLEMRTRPLPRPLPPAPLRLERWGDPHPSRYRALFARVGAPWLWFSRLLLDDAALAAIIGHDHVEVHAVLDRAGVEVGMLELDFRGPATCELAYLGLVPELAGKGLGRWLMGHALALAWRAGIERVWLHTCTLDHPSALGFYRRQGFTPFARAVEVFADPRTLGVLPPGVAPQVPLLAS